MTREEVAKRLKLPIDKLLTREDGRIEWICDHGVGHTIYSPKNMGKYGFVHGCDGCCNDINVIIEKNDN